jgi:branched-chain amino acid transport system permease protein
MGTAFAVDRTKTGLSLLAVRADEDKARGVGVHVTLVKLAMFGLSAAFTAATGAIWAYYISFVYPQFAVDPLVTIGMVLMTYLGGRATPWGPVLGAFLLAPVQQYFAYRFGASQLYLVAYAAVFLVVILLLPRGIVPTLSERFRRRDRSRHPAPVAERVAP